MAKTSFYLSKDLEKKLRLSPERGLSMAANRAIDRYYAMCDAERKKLEALFPEGEWMMMRNACNGTIWEPAETIRGGVLANCQDDIDANYDYYGADRTELSNKLIGLNVSQQFALVEMLEEWWGSAVIIRPIINKIIVGKIFQNLLLDEIQQLRNKGIV